MNSISTLRTTIAVAALMSFAGAAAAQVAKSHDHNSGAPAASATTADADMTNAEVRKVDVDAKKITLKHEAIKSLDMPGMTMVFQVKDASTLEKVKAGDKVKIKVISERGAYVVTHLQVVN
ncbi:MAG: copper-binding protein [Casimicrobium sp.]